jgi:DHA3 family macrolide efflux protein-like MFS transporter
MGPAIVGATIYVLDGLHLGPREVAWFEASLGAGYLVGAAAIARFGVAWRKGPTILWGMVLDGLTYLPFVVVDSWPLALVLIFVHGLFIPWIVVARTTLLQQHVPEERRGRVFALVGLTVAGMTALSALVAGALSEAFGPRASFWFAGVVGAGCGLAGLLVPTLRRAR